MDKVTDKHIATISILQNLKNYFSSLSDNNTQKVADNVYKLTESLNSMIVYELSNCKDIEDYVSKAQVDFLLCFDDHEDFNFSNNYLYYKEDRIIERDSLYILKFLYSKENFLRFDSNKLNSLINYIRSFMPIGDRKLNLPDSIHHLQFLDWYYIKEQ